MTKFVTEHGLGIGLLLALLLVASACAARYTVHPGALNPTDSAAYDALLVAEAAIDQARVEYQGSKEVLDTLIAAYNLARESWLTYRGAITTDMPAQSYLDRLSKNLTDLTAAIRAFKEAR